MQLDIIKRPQLNISDYQFLSAFKDSNETIYFRLLNEVKNKPPLNLECKLSHNNEEYPLHQELFEKYQKNGYGIYFVVNSGGTKKKHINRVNCHMLDMDFGKVPCIVDGEVQKEGKSIIYEYRTKNEINKYKKDFLKHLSSFHLLPSIVVETKNGLHVYWLINTNEEYDISLYEPLQDSLIEYFGMKEERKEHADSKVKTLERIMRVINYMHQKDPRDPFTIKCIYFDSKSQYNQSDIMKAINFNIPKIMSSKQNQSCSEEGIKNKPTLPCTHIVNRPSTSVDYSEIFEYLRKEIDLREFLSIDSSLNRSFVCPFHGDTNPSAVISRELDGSYRYFCKSNSCSFSSDKGLDIVDLTKLLYAYDTSGALKYLTQKYNIKIINKDFVGREQEKYRQNINLILDTKKFKSLFPYTHRIIRYSYNLLIKLNEIGCSNLTWDVFQVDNKSVFFASNRHLAHTLKKHARRTNQYLNLFCVLGLLEKIPNQKIPKYMLQRARKMAKEKGQNRINFYAIPNFNQVVSIAEKRAVTMIQYRFSIAGMSKKYIENLFGCDFANTIYHIKVYHSVERTLIRNIIEQLIIKNIEMLNFCTKENILKEDIIVNNQYISKSMKEYEFKRILPTVLKEHSLIYVKANKKINSALGINTHKYLIIRKDSI